MPPSTVSTCSMKSYYTIILLYYYTTILCCTTIRCYYTTIPLCYYNTIPACDYTSIPQYHYTSIPLYHYTTIPLHYYLYHHYTTSPGCASLRSCPSLVCACSPGKKLQGVREATNQPINPDGIVELGLQPGKPPEPRRLPYAREGVRGQGRAADRPR